MPATQELIDGLADRIEFAYRLRHPCCRNSTVSSRVWSVAASVLLDVHERHAAVPADPELFVASQRKRSFFADPWTEIAGPGAGGRYRKRVAEIVRSLRRELTAEVVFAERQIVSGRDVVDVLSGGGRRLSPMGKYIIARRAEDPVLAESFLSQASDQHNACPLYREASRKLLPLQWYPVSEDSSPSRPASSRRRSLPQVHLN